MAFQPAFNARLINEVKKHPCLYNHSRRGSGDTMERQRLWETIAKNIDLNCAAEFAKKRWLQLRDRYRKELKLAIKNNFVAPVRWCYFSQLSWLDPYLKDNIGQANVDDIRPISTDDSMKIESPFSWFDFPNLAGIKDEVMEEEGEDSDPALESSVLDRLLASATTQRFESVSPEIENDESGEQSVDGERDLDIDEIPQNVATSSKNPSSPLEKLDVKVELRDEEETSLSSAMEILASQAQSQKPSVESLIAANHARFAHHLAAQLSGMSQVMLNGSKRSESAATPQNFIESQTSQPMPNHILKADLSENTTRAHPYKDHYKRKQNRQNAEELMKHHLQQVGRAALEWLNDEDLLYSRIIGLKLKKMDPKKRKRVREQIMTLLEESSDDGDNDDSCSSARDHEEECHVADAEIITAD